MYEYRAQVVHIVDADTLDFDVDLGFDVHVKMRFRIRNLHAPERFTAEGKAITSYVTGLVGGGQCTVITHKMTSGEERDKYGRYIADVTLSDGRDFATEVKNFMVASGIPEGGM